MFILYRFFLVTEDFIVCRTLAALYKLPQTRRGFPWCVHLILCLVEAHSPILLAGSYFEAVITNTTSAFLVLGNVYAPHVDSDSDSEMELDHEEHSPQRHLGLRPVDERARTAKQVSLLVEIEGEAILGVAKASSILRIANDLDPRKTYKLRITHMGCQYGFDGLDDEILEFEGLWLDRPAASKAITRAANATMQTTLGVLLPHDQSQVYVEQEGSPMPSPKKQVIELVTSEYLAGDAWLKELYHPTTGTVEERVVSWCNVLGSRLSADIAMVPLARSALIPINAGQDGTETAAKDLFFRSGPKATARFFSRPWSFASYQPSVLILQLGLVDFVHFFSDKENANKHGVSKFTVEFVESYVQFVRTIRSNAYPFQKTAAKAWFGPSSDDGSYIYNSAPSTLPIFLIAPFSSRRRLVTKKLTLHKFISDALAQVASRLQAEGDKSTYWIDTTGWLDPSTDFNNSNTLYRYKDSPDANALTPAANSKVASLLADHLCPYLQGGAATSQPAFGDCAFDQYDSYLGNVYLPKDVELDRAVLERKIESIKQRLKMDGAGLKGRGETFLHKIKK